MSQIINVIEQRREAERDFVRAAACGIVQRVIEADSVLSVCPSGLISHDLQAQAVYSAIAAIAADLWCAPAISWAAGQLPPGRSH